MKIGHFSETYVPTPDGVATYIHTLKNSMKKYEQDIYVFTAAPSQEKNVFSAKSIPLNFYQQYRTPIFPFFSILKKMKETKFDLVHIYTPFMMGSIGYMLGRKFGLPVIATFHTDFINMQHSVKLPFKNFLFKLAWKYNLWLYKKCDLVITPTKIIEDKLKKEGIKNTKVVWHGIDPTNIRNANPEYAKQKLKLSDEKIVLFVGRLTKDKGIYTLLSIAEKLKSHNMIIIFAGTGPEEANLKEKAKKFDNVKVLGYVEEELKNSLYKLAFVFVLPSKAETFGYVLFEGMEADTPVIGAASGGILELIKDGENGFLIPFDDSKKLLEKILLLKENPELYKNIVSNGKEFLEKYGYIERHIESMNEIYIKFSN